MSIIIGRAGLIGADAAGVGEQLGIAFGVDHGLHSVVAAANPLRSRNTGSLARIHRYASRAPPSA